MQGPLDGVAEVQGGLSGEASSEVDVADARDPDRMAAAAIDLAQAQAHVTGASEPSTPAPGRRRATRPGLESAAGILPPLHTGGQLTRSLGAQHDTPQMKWKKPS